MDLEELRALIAVVEARSYQGAARNLGTSRTTLRRQLAALEARAGVPLLQADRSGMSATRAGQLLAEHGRTMMAEASALIASIRQMGQTPSGTLRLVLPVGLPPHLLTPMFASFRQVYPHLTFHCRFSNDPLGEALVDVDIACHLGEDPPRGHWISFVVARVRQVLIAAPSYLAERGTPRQLSDLAKHELLVWQAPGENARTLRTLKGGELSVEPALIATDIHFLRSCCQAGLGIAYVPDALLPEPERSGPAPVAVLPELVGQERSVRLSVPAALAEIPKIKLVLDHVRSLLG
ncbi:MAG: LysR family transcriptional regulator [Polyangiaceae bacterium]|nr:LysR family transcriptional regulator [Polyangiaceae bacterium]